MVQHELRERLLRALLLPPLHGFLGAIAPLLRLRDPLRQSLELLDLHEELIRVSHEPLGVRQGRGRRGGAPARELLPLEALLSFFNPRSGRVGGVVEYVKESQRARDGLRLLHQLLDILEGLEVASLGVGVHRRGAFLPRLAVGHVLPQAVQQRALLVGDVVLVDGGRHSWRRGGIRLGIRRGSLLPAAAALLSLLTALRRRCRGLGCLLRGLDALDDGGARRDNGSDLVQGNRVGLAGGDELGGVRPLSDAYALPQRREVRDRAHGHGLALLEERSEPLELRVLLVSLDGHLHPLLRALASRLEELNPRALAREVQTLLQESLRVVNLRGGDALHQRLRLGRPRLGLLHRGVHRVQVVGLNGQVDRAGFELGELVQRGQLRSRGSVPPAG